MRPSEESVWFGKCKLPPCVVVQRMFYPQLRPRALGLHNLENVFLQYWHTEKFRQYLWTFHLWKVNTKALISPEFLGPRCYTQIPAVLSSVGFLYWRDYKGVTLSHFPEYRKAFYFNVLTGSSLDEFWRWLPVDLVWPEWRSRKLLNQFWNKREKILRDIYRGKLVWGRLNIKFSQVLGS